MRFLIIAAAAGDGHLSAARSIAKALDQRTRGRDGVDGAATVTTVVDALDYGPRWFRVWFEGGYETLVRRAPRLWGALYRGSDRPGFLYSFQTALDTLCLNRLQPAIKADRPDWIVCTHSLPQPRLGLLRRGWLTGGPGVAVVVTDLHPHRMWLRGSPDRYFVPSETTRDRLERLRPGSAAITTVTGIPVDPACTDAVTRAEARVQLGRDGGAPSVVLMSGGIGGGPIARAMEVLLTAGSPGGAQVDLTVVCGRNERARKRCLASLNGKPAKGADAQVLGYVPHDEFLLRLRAADIIVGKPGGVTMAEALACGAPMIIYRPMLIPGQEEDNAAFLLDTGSAIKADGPDDLRQTVAGLLSTPERLARMQANALAASRPGAAFAIADALLAS